MTFQSIILYAVSLSRKTIRLNFSKTHIVIEAIFNINQVNHNWLYLEFKRRDNNKTKSMSDR